MQARHHLHDLSPARLVRPPFWFLLLLAAIAFSACSDPKPEAFDCNATCNGKGDAFTILGWIDDDGAIPIGRPLTMEYGPQGGQHVFLAVEVRVPTSERLRFSFDYIDAQSDRVLAEASWQEDLEECGYVIESIPLVFRRDEAARGHVEMTVTAGDCKWQASSAQFDALPPPQQRDGGTDQSDGGTSNRDGGTRGNQGGVTSTDAGERQDAAD